MNKGRLVFLINILFPAIFASCSNSYGQSTIISCPNLSAKQYGQVHFYDRKSGRLWDLSWSDVKKPVWDSAIIPESKLCGGGRAANGVPFNYQCAVFQCKSSAAVASLGELKPIKCYSAYVSTQKNFYCNGFTNH